VDLTDFVNELKLFGSKRFETTSAKLDRLRQLLQQIIAGNVARTSLSTKMSDVTTVRKYTTV